jgi:hypothetical protein
MYRYIIRIEMLSIHKWLQLQFTNERLKRAAVRPAFWIIYHHLGEGLVREQLSRGSFY